MPFLSTICGELMSFHEFQSWKFLKLHVTLSMGLQSGYPVELV